MITAHVLDTALGRPGAAIAVEPERGEAGTWQQVGAGVTDDDGRLRTLTPAGAVAAGAYRFRFHTHPYFASCGQTAFFPVVEIQFPVVEGAQHYHVPLLLSPYAIRRIAAAG